MLFFISRVYFHILRRMSLIRQCLFTIWYTKLLKSCGKNSKIHYTTTFLSLDRISIGDNFDGGARLKLRAHKEFRGKHNPNLQIGNNFYVGSDCYISAVGNIIIGNDVTLASRVTIIDHSHGIGDYSDIEIPVMQRKLGVKGDIIIEDNVWLCEGVVVLSGVRIGKNSIIGANAVVTKDIPANSIAVGIPAKVIKTIQR